MFNFTSAIFILAAAKCGPGRKLDLFGRCQETCEYEKPSVCIPAPRCVCSEKKEIWDERANKCVLSSQCTYKGPKKSGHFSVAKEGEKLQDDLKGLLGGILHGHLSIGGSGNLGGTSGRGGVGVNGVGGAGGGVGGLSGAGGGSAGSNGAATDGDSGGGSAENRGDSDIGPHGGSTAGVSIGVGGTGEDGNGGKIFFPDILV